MSGGQGGGRPLEADRALGCPCVGRPREAAGHWRIFVTIRAFHVFRSTQNRGISVEPETYGVLVDFCCKEGDALIAMRIVDGMVVDGCFLDNNAWCSILVISWAGRKVREEAELIWDELLC
ncbi:hypothetical protein KSP40_PGU002760 [Platanthera guangdongensis]|uniref:Pentatricopeptide repeat-containing protein n=1 Tax=Platanthera guangdongensis TaxID=2320717 RepID=A0ABR2MAU3_9ASPA